MCLQPFRWQGASGTAHSLDMAVDKTSNTSQSGVYKVPPAKWLAEFWLNDVMLFPLSERTHRDPCIKATNFARTVLWRRSASHHVDRYIRRYGCFGYGFSNWLVWRASFQISSCTFDECVCSFSSVEIFWRKEPECLGNLYGQGLQAIRWINGLTPRI